MSSIDLTPFGFTPTESRVYAALLDAGPSSGYALAGPLKIARANVYQALRGLEAKHAAVSIASEPRTFRAVHPDALLAQVAQEQAGRLDALERQIATHGRAGAPATIEFSGERELEAIALRTATRSPALVRFVGPAGLLARLAPIWRKRLADGLPTDLWSTGTPPSGFQLPLAGTIDQDRLALLCPGCSAALVTEASAALLRTDHDRAIGIWSTNPLVVGAARGALAHILTSRMPTD